MSGAFGKHNGTEKSVPAPPHSTSPKLNAQYRNLFLSIALTFVCASHCPADTKEEASGEKEEQPLELSIETIFGKSDFNAKSFSAKWSKQPKSYLRFVDGDGGKDLVLVDALTKEQRVLVSAGALVPSGASAPISISSYQWAPNRSKLLIYTNTKKVWRQNTRGDYWVLDVTNGELKQIGGDAPPSSLMFAKFSPDGNNVAYVYDRDIYSQSLLDNRITRITKAASKDQIHGTFDWVYEEELGLRDGFRWSPDSQSIAFWQIDTSGVSKFTMINNTDSFYPTTTVFAYPKTGQRNSICRVGIASAHGGKTRWIKLPGDNRDNYIARMDWIPDSDQLVLQRLNRLQNTNQIIVVDPDEGTGQTIYTERDDAWVNMHDEMFWVDDNQRFTWISEHDGWRHVYLISRDGNTVDLVTKGEFDVIRLLKVDEDNRRMYFAASPDDPTQAYLYSVAFDGSQRQRLTPTSQPGSHMYTFSADASLAIHTWSRFGEPPRTELIRLPSHETVEQLEDNSELREKLAKLNLGKTELFRVAISATEDNGEQIELDGWSISPPNFDPDRRYPLFVYVYGEPAGTTVRDHWGGRRYLWHQMLAQQGYFVMSFDNRGTPAPRGRDWRRSIYRQVGILAPQDQAAAVKQVLAERPYLDPDRIGIWGWSGGGSMTLNAIFKYPDLYRTGISIAPVPNMRHYDTIYQERYMGLPNDNVEGYRDGSPIHFAHQLKGNLLLVHGTGDDNCHYQTMELLINELIKHGKQFTMMSYPNRSHSIREGKGTTKHLRTLMTDYLHANLPAGPR